MVADPVVGFVPPPYPYDRLDALEAARRQPARRRRRLLDRHAVRSGARRRARAPRPARSPTRWATRASAGSAALREAAAALDRPPLRRARSRRAHVGACVGTKELVAVAAAPAAAAQPAARHRAVSRRSRTRATRWARCSPAVARCRFRSTPTGTSTSTRSPTPTPSARCCCGSTSPATPRRRPPTPRTSRASRRGRAPRGIVVASDECYAEFAPEPATILASGLDGVLAMHSVSKRSNLAGMRVGFYAGDPDLVYVSRRDAQARRA